MLSSYINNGIFKMFLTECTNNYISITVKATRYRII